MAKILIEDSTLNKAKTVLTGVRGAIENKTGQSLAGVDATNYPAKINGITGGGGSSDFGQYTKYMTETTTYTPEQWEQFKQNDSTSKTFMYFAPYYDGLFSRPIQATKFVFFCGFKPKMIKITLDYFDNDFQLEGANHVITEAVSWSESLLKYGKNVARCLSVFDLLWGQQNLDDIPVVEKRLLDESETGWWIDEGYTDEGGWMSVPWIGDTEFAMPLFTDVNPIDNVNVNVEVWG